MNTRQVIITLLISLSTFAFGKIDVDASNVPKILNLGEVMAAYSKQSQGAPLERKIEVFNKLLIAPNALVFKQLVFQGDDPTHYLREQLPKSEESFAKGSVLAADFNSLIAETIEKMKKVFPKADYRYTAYVMPSFMFDGKADELSDGTIAVAYGVDRLARYKRENLKIVIAHEMFHALQMQTFRTKYGKGLPLTSLWHDIWVEGLATFASGEILGLSQIADVLGKKNVEGCRKDVGSEKSQVLTNFDKSSTDISPLMDKWFGGHQFAYCLGYLAIQKISKKHTLNTLIEWELAPSTRKALFDEINAISEVK
jgi:hypothetical protein